MENSQLFKRNSESGYQKVYPLTTIKGVIDESSGKYLSEILHSINHVYLPYKGDRLKTRASLPVNFRKSGVWITYKAINKLVTEYFKGTSKDLNNDSYFSCDDNWEPIPDLKFIQSNASKIPTGAILP